METRVPCGPAPHTVASPILHTLFRASPDLYTNEYVLASPNLQREPIYIVTSKMCARCRACSIGDYVGTMALTRGHVTTHGCAAGPCDRRQGATVRVTGAAGVAPRGADEIPAPLRWVEARGGRSPVVCALLGRLRTRARGSGLDREGCCAQCRRVSTWPNLGRPPDLGEVAGDCGLAFSIIKLALLMTDLGAATGYGRTQSRYVKVGLLRRL